MNATKDEIRCISLRDLRLMTSAGWEIIRDKNDIVTVAKGLHIFTYRISREVHSPRTA